MATPPTFLCISPKYTVKPMFLYFWVNKCKHQRCDHELNIFYAQNHKKKRTSKFSKEAVFAELVKQQYCLSNFILHQVRFGWWFLGLW